MKKKMITLILTLIFPIMLTAPPFPVCYIERPEMIIEPLTWSNVDFWLKEYQIKQIPIVKKQIFLETGNFTSRICLEQNNLIGMRPARIRETTAIGEYNDMAIYRTWVKSIQDYKIWQDEFYRGGNYYLFLARIGYAEEDDYVEILKKIKI